MPDPEQLVNQNGAALLPPKTRKETAYRLARFVNWLTAQERSWLQPDLGAYQRYLIEEEGFSDQTVASQISTIRRRYRDLLKDRETFVELVGPDQNLEEIIFSILEAIDPATARVAADPSLRIKFKVLTKYELFLEIVKNRVEDNRMGSRDIALIELMLMTGIRESEVISLKVADLEHKLGDQPALRIGQGEASKTRLTPYLEGSVPKSVTKWIGLAGLGQGEWLFRTFYQGGNVMRRGHMQLAAVRQVLERYPYAIEQDKEVVITSTDMRATYAWQMYQRGHSVEAIAQYLGASTALVNRFVTDRRNGYGGHS
jgi:integrase